MNMTTEHERQAQGLKRSGETAGKASDLAEWETPMAIQHLTANNDANGNPRRVWAVYSRTGGILDVIDEGYSGFPSKYRDLPQLPTVSIDGAEYREWMHREENLKGRFEVVDKADGFVWHRFYTRAKANKYRREHHNADGLEVREVEG